MDNHKGTAVVVGVSGGVGGAIARVLARQGRYEHIFGLSRSRPQDWSDETCGAFIQTDIRQEDDIAAAARIIEQHGPVHRVVVATGLLHRQGMTPEKTMRALDADTLLELFAINTVAPAIIAKHFLPLAPREEPSLFAALSARVGSISDNRLGGWYGYRASKAALNMLIKTLAIEQARSRPLSVCVALHPGTVATRLSDPFSSARTARLTPDEAGEALVDVMDRLGPTHSGGFYAWDGKPIPW